MLSFFSFFRQGFIGAPALAGGEQEWVNRFPCLLAHWEGSCFFLYGVRVEGCIQGLGWRSGSGGLPTSLPVVCAGGMLSFWQGCLLLKKSPAVYLSYPMSPHWQSWIRHDDPTEGRMQGVPSGCGPLLAAPASTNTSVPPCCSCLH